MKSGFAFVVSHLEIGGKLPVEILDGYSFRAASDKEVEIIENITSQHGSWPWPAYSDTLTVVEETGAVKRSDEKLPREQWKYWVIAYEYGDQENRIPEIEQAFMLLSPDIEIGFVVVFEESRQLGRKLGHLSPPSHIVEKYTKPPKCTEFANAISIRELEKVDGIVRSMDALNEQYYFIKFSIENLYSIKAIETHSNAYIIMCFSIIEALITHKPSGPETKDSITHQIKNKMNLLQKKYVRKVPISDYFDENSATKIWNKLYDYRSVLAHGDKPDFEDSKKHKTLKDQKTISIFLKENIKELILLALDDPEFIADLREC